uniref:LIM zinc-binding domain-containing protein n=1 Tax=Oryzias melastigma TaxID=30732 RepID=A0A3B3CM20_ORYME
METVEVGVSCSLTCFFCKERLYVIERLTAEGLFFHRSCFTCHSCGSALRPPSYTFDQHRGQCLHQENPPDLHEHGGETF